MQTTNVALTIGMDLGDKSHELYILNVRGEIIKEEQISNEISALNEYFDNFQYPKNVVVRILPG